MKSIDQIRNNQNIELPIKHEIDLLIFDLDGTLVDSLAGVLFSIHETFRFCELPSITDREIHSYIGVGVLEMISRASGISQEEERFCEIYTTFKSIFTKHADNHSSLYLNTIEILEHFSEKRKVIVTNRKADIARSTLRYFNLTHHFEAIIGSDDACAKPSRCPLDKALEHTECAPERAVIIGDMDIDIHAGKNAGIVTCAVRGGIGKLTDIIEADPDFLINDLIQLKEIFI